MRASHLGTRPLLAQHNRTALIEANHMERVLADIDTDYGDYTMSCLGHGVLLVPFPASIAGEDRPLEPPRSCPGLTRFRESAHP